MAVRGTAARYFSGRISLRRALWYHDSRPLLCGKRAQERTGRKNLPGPRQHIHANMQKRGEYVFVEGASPVHSMIVKKQKEVRIR